MCNLFVHNILPVYKQLTNTSGFYRHYQHLYKVNKNFISWLLFVILSLVWGSSFILMKIGLNNHLTAYQIAAIRIAAAGLVLLPVALRFIKKISLRQLLLIVLSGALGSLIPAFLFCIAEQGIDSALAGALNSLTPIFVIITGAVFFNSKTASNKILGIIVAFTGSVLLLLSKGDIQQGQHIIYVLLVILATLLYGFNVNMVLKHLIHIPSLHIAAIALAINGLFAFIILIFTGYFSLPLGDAGIIKATVAAVTLGIAGTAAATVLFYMLVKRAGAIFASMVTYGIPFVAIAWGFYFGEQVGWKQLGALLVILLGVYLANKRTNKLDA
jgi:drug/metabolite transporter (DMT)-like permease